MNCSSHFHAHSMLRYYEKGTSTYCFGNTNFLHDSTRNLCKIWSFSNIGKWMDIYWLLKQRVTTHRQGWQQSIWIQTRRVGNGTCRRSHFTSLDVRTSLGFSIDFAFNYDSKSAVLLGFSFFFVFVPQRQANFRKIPVSPRMRFWDAMCLCPQRRAFFTCAFCFVKTWLLERHTAKTSSHAQHVWTSIASCTWTLTSHPTPPPHPISGVASSIWALSHER